MSPYLKPSLHPAPVTRPIPTAHLAQTMSLLELTAAELTQKIEAELASNPALELKGEKLCPSCQKPLPATNPCPRCSAPHSLTLDEPIIFVSPRQDFHFLGDQLYAEPPDEDISPASEELSSYVLRQIAPDLHPDDRRLAAFILNNLNEDGLLEISLVEIARYSHVPPSRIENLLRLIQRADPLGVGSPSPQDALLVQLEVLAETMPVPSLAVDVITTGMDLLSRRQFSELACQLGAPVRKIREVAQFIAYNLNPYPGRASWGDIRHGSCKTPNVYWQPDVVITLLNEIPEHPLVIEIVSPYFGLLQVNPLFRQALRQAPLDKAEQWKSDLEGANLLVKCLQQRTNTIVRMMRCIAKFQRDFIIHGDRHLHPLTRASLAKELMVHESTISRAVASKTAQLPNGHIVPLARFFDRSLNVRTVLKDIIEQETSPLSDSQIANLLKEHGFSVARRTVAKYRTMEGILPSHLRQTKPAPESE